MLRVTFLALCFLATPALASSCKTGLAKYKSVIDSDLETGDTTKEVHARISADLAPAERACSNGQEGAALGLLASVKKKYGYPQ